MSDSRMSNEKPVVFDDDNPEWTEEDFRRARPISDFPELAAAFAKARRGRPIGSTKPHAKKSLTLRLDPDVIEGWRASGPGWQTRMNEALREALEKKSA
ncbi:MAG TPA: BrnA antitoxin family protein [Sphingomonadaceae bacterium]